MMHDMGAEEIIKTLRLDRHPEGGWYRQTWIEDTAATGAQGETEVQKDAPRPSGTCIYFLLRAGEASHWHRVDATEIWLYHAGAPLILSLSATDSGPALDHLLSPDLRHGRPQLIVPKDHWQAARSTGDWTLVSCTVSPGFDFSGFELAPDSFDIPR